MYPGQRNGDKSVVKKIKNNNQYKVINTYTFNLKLVKSHVVIVSYCNFINFPWICFLKLTVDMFIILRNVYHLFSISISPLGSIDDGQVQMSHYNTMHVYVYEKQLSPFTELSRTWNTRFFFKNNMCKSARLSNFTKLWL